MEQEKLLKRLELIGNLIGLGDYEDIQGQVLKLRGFGLPAEVLGIVSELERGRYSGAGAKISEYLQANRGLVRFGDREREGYRLKIRMLKVQIGVLENEKGK